MEISDKVNSSSYISYHETDMDNLRESLRYFTSAIEQAQDINQLFDILDLIETKVSPKIRRQLKRRLQDLIDKKLQELGSNDNYRDLLVRPRDIKPEEL